MRIPEAWVFKEWILRRLAAKGIANCLTGNPKDLRRLLRLRRIPLLSPGMQVFLNHLSRDLDSKSGMARLLLHLGKNVGSLQKRRLVENLIFNWKVSGTRIRARLSTLDYWVPHFFVISPTMRCNLKCTGCYSALYAKDGELSEGELDRLLAECRRLGSYFVVISGGEPFLLKDSLLRLFGKYQDVFFLTFTNGTCLDEGLVRELAALGNVGPAISIEGFQDSTDRRRGSGIYEKAMNAMALLKKHGMIFGISVTYTSRNIDEVTDEKFIKHFVDQGACFAWYFMFMPVGREPVFELVPSPERRLYCGRRVAELRRQYPIFLADFWNDGPAVGGCLAGGRRYLHILNSGRVEPCVFAHFGTDNIRDKSLLEAVNSPFFRAIRREFPFNEYGNLKRPCMIVDNPGILRRLVEEYVVPAGHDLSEDLVHDPRAVEWLDAYAERMEQLTESEWRQLIENPDDRWYKGNQEYKNMFRFKNTPRPPRAAQ